MTCSSASPDPVGDRVRCQPWLGTLVHVRLPGDGAREQPAIAAAFAAIADVQRQMSFHDPDSALSRLNREAARRAVAVPPGLARVLRAALALAAASDGAFDPTVARHQVAQGRLPAPDGQAPDPDADWRDVQWLADGRLRFRRPLWLDLGGIAKGHAVDRAVAALRRLGVTAGCVNAGGDLRSFGRDEIVPVRDPADPGRAVARLQVRDAAVATSAGSFEDRPGYTAVLSPRSGRRLAATRSATVCAPRAIWADALTKVVLADPACARRLLPRLAASARLFHADGRVEAVA